MVKLKNVLQIISRNAFATYLLESNKLVIY